jgi:acetolactate synthase-1/2/3 large subunit
MQRSEWIRKCNEWKRKWPVINETHLSESGELDIYAVLNHVCKFSHPEDIIMGDAGSISYAGPVALESKLNQRFIFSPAQADMGWALPASIGVSMASEQQVIVIVGDGSFMSNIQELAVIREHWLNIKFVILNNDGYLSIRNTQSRFYGRVHGTDSKTGLWFPDFFDVANAFDMAYVECTHIESLSKLKAVFASDGPVIINCICKYDQQILPAQSYRDGIQAPLHDMAPFLDKEELRQEMFYKDLI